MILQSLFIKNFCSTFELINKRSLNMNINTKPQTRNEKDILKSSNAINKLMLLPSESQKGLQKKADENHQLHLICESQNVILSNYSDSYSEKLKIEQKIAEVDKEIQKFDTLLADANYILLNTLKKEPQKESEVGDFLKIILEKIKNLIMSICKESLNDKSISVSLMSVIEIEQQIQKIIETQQNDDFINNNNILISNPQNYDPKGQLQRPSTGLRLLRPTDALEKAKIITEQQNEEKKRQERILQDIQFDRNIETQTQRETLDEKRKRALIYNFQKDDNKKTDERENDKRKKEPLIHISRPSSRKRFIRSSLSHDYSIRNTDIFVNEQKNATFLH